MLKFNLLRSFLIVRQEGKQCPCKKRIYTHITRGYHSSSENPCHAFQEWKVQDERKHKAVASDQSYRDHLTSFNEQMKSKLLSTNIGLSLPLKEPIIIFDQRDSSKHGATVLQNTSQNKDKPAKKTKSKTKKKGTKKSKEIQRLNKNLFLDYVTDSEIEHMQDVLGMNIVEDIHAYLSQAEEEQDGINYFNSPDTYSPGMKKYVKNSLLSKGITITSKIENLIDHVIEQVQTFTQMDYNYFMDPKLTHTLEKETNLKEMQLLFQETIKLLFGENFGVIGVEKTIEKLIGMKYKHRFEDANSLVEVMLANGDVKAVHQMISHAYLRCHKNSAKWSKNVLNDISIYNKVIWALAKQGRFPMIEVMTKQMNELKVSATLDTYGAVLACLGRQKEVQVELVQKTLVDLEKEGFQLHHLKNKLVTSEWDFIERAVRSARPEYLPMQYGSCKEKTLPYQSELLQQFIHTGDQSYENPFYGVLGTQELENRVNRKFEEDTENMCTVTSIYPSPPLTDAMKQNQQNLNEFKVTWREALNSAFHREKSIMQRQRHNRETAKLLPFLCAIPDDEYVSIMMDETNTLLELINFSPKLHQMEDRLGKAVYRLYRMHETKKNGEMKKAVDLYKEFVNEYNKPVLSKNHREIWEDILSSNGCDYILTESPQIWSTFTNRKIGSFLYKLIMDEIKFKPVGKDPPIPAFYKIRRVRYMSSYIEIKVHPTLGQMHQDLSTTNISFDIQDLPSLVPPIPWCNARYGVNVNTPATLLKISPKHETENLEEKDGMTTQLLPVFDAINAVSMTPWIINKCLLDIIINTFNTGGDPSLKVPPNQSSFPEYPTLNSKMTSQEKYDAIQKKNKLMKEKNEVLSLWYTELYRLSIAKKYEDEVFWFAHDLDFRGRAYPCSPHFNHIGNDLTRSIMKFAKGKPLGKDGLNWLKIHLVNLSGQAKRYSIEERLAYANAHIDEILESAHDPYQGKMWWKTCDEPWQALACCKEISLALCSPNPEEYVCHFPVHQDGSCNGLQHYAALGRDKGGAEAVNLAPFDKPQDVYSDVLIQIEEERAKDAKAGVDIAQLLEGVLHRKVIKQTVMTTVYGVTMYGAKQQIKRQLEDSGAIPEERLTEASAYLAVKTFHCLQKMFTSTKKIQEWLVLCATLISYLDESVQWETPLGLPVIQPYYRKSRVSLKKDNMAVIKEKFPQLKLSSKFDVGKPNTIKQRNGFPPNYIHSLDATHMMLTSIGCLRAGITFVSVHDCYWTHPCDVSIMNKICREQFVALHQQPLLENLAASMLKQYGFDLSKTAEDKEKIIQAKRFVNSIFQRVPERGQFQLDSVLDSTYFFS